MESVLKKKLRSQKRAVKTIAGQPPSIALGCVASFPPQETGLRIDAFDPSENERKAIDLEIDVDRFVLAYYEPFLTAIENASEIELNDTFVTGTFPSLGLRIGLHNRVVEQVSSASQHGYAGLADRVFRALSNVAADEQHQFADGSRFLTEWDAALEIQDYEI